ncbi:glutathione S-transferase [Bosea caraganae]|uniref:Glutathione S-transferase n=1 Tax=Bosea caraganae TaxID=2763117 RepID=A0A370LAF8_9HYPH|nr:glutathione S-transferase [Bosea caraganae]RDJ21682.1 glutathione S-transferase [Bosea caraganae]RDJ28287.1 glutathione S-transferase [Bosea caraganae]
MTPLRILGKASSINVRKVLWTCREVGLDYRREDWGSGFTPTDKPEFLALNPNGLVPVIEDEAGVLWESNTICRYLAAKAGRLDLLPAQPRERARVEQWMDWQATELNNSWRYAFLALARRNPAYADPSQIAASTRSWNTTMKVLERQLEGSRAYVLGDCFTLADIGIGLSVHRWFATPLEERPLLPAVAAYYDRLSERPAYLELGRNGIA